MDAGLTPLLIAVVTVGVALAGLIVGLFGWLRQDSKQTRQEIAVLRQEMRKEIGALRQEMRKEIGALRQEVGALRQETGELRERMAHLEGLLEGLREAIVAGARRQAAE